LLLLRLSSRQLRTINNFLLIEELVTFSIVALYFMFLLLLFISNLAAPSAGGQPKYHDHFTIFLLWRIYQSRKLLMNRRYQIGDAFFGENYRTKDTVSPPYPEKNPISSVMSRKWSLKLNHFLLKRAC
jgi:hypothetical protein